MIEMRWNKYEVSLASPYFIFLTPVLNSRGMKKLRYAIQEKLQKSSWDEPYSSFSTKQSCSKMALLLLLLLRVFVCVVLRCLVGCCTWFSCCAANVGLGICVKRGTTGD